MDMTKAVCEYCKHFFAVDLDSLKWMEELFDAKLGYRTWKANLYCPSCGMPKRVYKRD
jgi:rubredoxin